MAASAVSAGSLLSVCAVREMGSGFFVKPFQSGPLRRSFFALQPNLHQLICTILLLPVCLPLYHCIQRDYAAFLALGPGGTPSTFGGYLRVTFLKFFFARTDTLTPPCPLPSTSPYEGYLQSLPKRAGTRPKVAGIAPHRQITQKGSKKFHAAVSTVLQRLQAANSQLLGTGVSCFEKTCFALFFTPQFSRLHNSAASRGFCATAHPAAVSAHLLTTMRDSSQTCANPAAPAPYAIGPVNPTCGHPAEIAHLHAVDSSMHLTLHPHDVAEVLSRGWGERHPLAGRGPWVPRGFVMVYAPQTEEDLAVLAEIVKAAAWWVGAVCLNDAEAEPTAEVCGDGVA